MADEPTTTKTERALALVTYVWIPLVWLLAVTDQRMPTAWRWALTVFGAYGLFESTATLADKRGSWSRSLTISRYVSIGLVAVALFYVVLTDGR